MHKLVILIENAAELASFDEQWPRFLHLAENMPGLQREVTSRVESQLYGSYKCLLIHELHFETLAAIQEAMSSAVGQAAGELLQQMTGGRLTLLLADHKEDGLDHIRQYARQNDAEDAAPDARPR
jgi:uncharacterized protein (TIGR02118 family)